MHTLRSTKPIKGEIYFFNKKISIHIYLAGSCLEKEKGQARIQQPEIEPKLGRYSEEFPKHSKSKISRRRIWESLCTNRWINRLIS
jgi:hypothetical protein